MVESGGEVEMKAESGVRYLGGVESKEWNQVVRRRQSQGVGGVSWSGGDEGRVLSQNSDS